VPGLFYLKMSNLQDDGWIKLHRTFLKWEWLDKSEMVLIWIYLILKANHKDSKWHGIEVKRGQLITSRQNIARDTHLSEQIVRTCLKRLKSTSELTSISTSKYTILTICNYDRYQTKDVKTNQHINQHINQQSTSNQPATNQQLTTNKNDKNNKNDNNDKNKDTPPIFSKKEIVIPSWFDFKEYALEHKPNVDQVDLKCKYDAWKEDGWKKQGNKQIKNWKSTLLHTLPYLKNKYQNTKKDEIPESSYD